MHHPIDPKFRKRSWIIAGSYLISVNIGLRLPYSNKRIILQNYPFGFTMGRPNNEMNTKCLCNFTNLTASYIKKINTRV